jgi:class 3 adenylate cyclase/Flp pilus assembly protein TadD
MQNLEGVCNEQQRAYTRTVLVCPNCGEDNPDRFRLCGFCGTPLVPALPRQEVRKTVTIVFSDLQGSTSLGEKLDSESLREVLSRYFEVMRSILEDHSGTVEKYIGDAIMAVFGLPRVHEDDALRAVTAALKMQRALGVLNEELERRWGVRLVNRTGVNTGEVVAGDPRLGQRLVSGDAVNVAARLEQAAPPLGTLIGDVTYRLVRHAVDAERVEPLELKGKSVRVPAYRLVDLARGEQPPGRTRTTMVGREAELARLLGALEEAASAHAPRVVLVLGDPGVGKTRLTEELSARARNGATVLRGRCLSYGRGITFWPLVEVVREATGIQSDDQPHAALAKLDALLTDAPDVAARIASAIGLGATTFPLQEIYWATRKLFETLAARRPLLIVIEDAHWAEPAFLDLIEYVARQVTESLLVVCSGRPELLEVRPAWGEHATWPRLHLQPLRADESASLIEHLLGDSGLPWHISDPVVGAAEGNPLFVEQLVSKLLEDGLIRREPDGWCATTDLSELAVPSSIEALLAARLELLNDQERAVLEPASVIGLIFCHDALADLVPDALRQQVDEHLEVLVRKRLLQLDSIDSYGRWYRFQHILIRDTAYRRLLKRSRAMLHERFADWGERVNRDREGAVEYDEIHGYHLEQAYRYLSELGPLDEHGRHLGARGAAHLGAAGNRAFERGDMAAASNLLRRATALLPAGALERVALLPKLGEALMESGEFASAESLLEEAINTTAVLGDGRLHADALLSRLLVRHHAADDLGAWCVEVETETKRLIPPLETLQADAELAKAWRLVAFVHGSVCQWEKTAVAEQRALEHARRAGRARLEARLSAALAQALRDGPTPVPEAIARCEAIIEAGLVDQQAEVQATINLAYLHALAGDVETARGLCRQARTRLTDLGGGALSASSLVSLTISRVELLAEQPGNAEPELRLHFDALGGIGERYFRPLTGALLAQLVYTSGKTQEAMFLTSKVEEMAAADDVEVQALWRSVRAKVLARDGHVGAAVRLTREAVQVLQPTDALVMKGDTFLDQAIVFMCAGRDDDAVVALRRARELYLLKGAIHPLSRVDALLAKIDTVLRADLASGPASQPAASGTRTRSKGRTSAARQLRL